MNERKNFSLSLSLSLISILKSQHKYKQKFDEIKEKKKTSFITIKVNFSRQ